MRPELTKYTVLSYFSGKATALQKQMIAEWLTENKNVEVYFEWLEEWERTQLQFQPGVSLALQKVTEQLETNQARVSIQNLETPKKESLIHVILWAVASLIVIGIGAYLGKDTLQYRTYVTAYGQLTKFHLEDSTLVSLNANSKLKVPRWGFGKSTRHVYLEGEAEFLVKHTVDHQYFKVHIANSNLITVLGTEFVVYSRSKHANVILNHGSVELSSPKRVKALKMEPGDRATIEMNGDVKVEKLSEKELHTQAAWKEHRFVFDDTPLLEVAEKIREIFGVEVSIKNRTLATRTATGSFPAKNAEELLINMSYMYNFEIAKAHNKLILIPNP
jgi:transmembrane sensor